MYDQRPRTYSIASLKIKFRTKRNPAFKMLQIGLK